MATIKFLLQSNSNMAPIYLRLSNGRKVNIKRKIGLYINPSNWSKNTGLPKQNNATNKNLYSDLKELESVIHTKLNEASKIGQIINGDWLDYTINNHFGRVNQLSISELVLDQIQDIIDNAEDRPNAKGGFGLSKSRINSYKSLIRLFSEFQENKNYRVIEINIELANNFKKFLIKDKKYDSSFAMKKIADLKTVCNNARSKGIEVNHQLNDIKIKFSSNENIIYLSKDELKKIENASLKSEALINARKWLLLGCSLGQRGGDLLNIKSNNIIQHDGYEVIELRQQKTGKNITIPVLPNAKKIINEGLPYKVSTQKLNEHFKEICKISKIDEPTKGKIFDNKLKRKKVAIYPKWQLISTHICRRSFATNLYGELDTSLIMQVTGHSSEKMLLKYIGKTGLDFAKQILEYYKKNNL
jgi:integrase